MSLANHHITTIEDLDDTPSRLFRRDFNRQPASFVAANACRAPSTDPSGAGVPAGVLAPTQARLTITTFPATLFTDIE